MAAPTERLAATRWLSKLTDRCVVGVSGGKDSVAVCDLLHGAGVRLSGFFLYAVPGLSFQQRYLDYLRRRYDMEIVEWPHPDLPLRLLGGRYCTALPSMPQVSFREVWDAARARFGTGWVATGEKRCDSLQRRAMLSAWGEVQVARRRAFPLANWSHRDVYAYLKHRRVMLPPDYALFGHSMADPLRSDDLSAIQATYPEDYERICRLHPFAGAGVVRHGRRVARAEAHTASALRDPHDPA